MTRPSCLTPTICAFHLGFSLVAASALAGETGTYTLSVREVTPPSDDCPHDTTTTCEVDVGGSATGNIEIAGDADWFKVQLAAGKFYQIDLVGAGGGGGTLGDPYLRNIRDASGDEISETGNDDIDATLRNYDSRVILNPTAAGAYYLVAGGAAMADTGTYTLSATEVETRTTEGDTDFPSDITTLGLVEVSGSATGEIDPVSDIDWFRVVLEYDKTYVFDLEGTQTSAGTLANPRLSVRDHTVQIQYSSDDDGGEGLNSRLEFTATYSGIHYLVASAALSASSGGTYTLSARETAIVSEGDTDCPQDDITTHCVVAVGGSFMGNIETNSDLDWIKVVLEASTRYQIDVEGADTDRGTLADPLLFGGYDSNAFSISGLRNGNGGVGKNARKAFTPSADGTYYVSVTSELVHATGIGTYTLSVTVLEPRTVEGRADFADDVNTLGRVQVGGSATGNIDSEDDKDWFKVVLEAGKTYQFDMEGVDTERGTLTNPWLFLRNEPGTLIITYNDDRYNGNIRLSRNSRIIHAATAAGAHYLEARGSVRKMGTYTLSAREITPADRGTPSDDPNRPRVTLLLSDDNPFH